MLDLLSLTKGEKSFILKYSMASKLVWAILIFHSSEIKIYPSTRKQIEIQFEAKWRVISYFQVTVTNSRTCVSRSEDGSLITLEYK